MLQLKRSRIERGWTLHETARRAKLHDSDLSKIENGWSRPYPNQAKRLARVLGINVDELLMEESHEANA